MNKSIAANKAKVLGVASVVVVGGLCAGCDPRENDPMNYYEVRLEADAPNQEKCQEPVSIRFSPVKVAAQSANSLYETEEYWDYPTIIGQPVLDGPGNYECWFTYRSHDLAPGTWKITAQFSSGPKGCERDVLPGKRGKVLLAHVRIDQQEGCVEFDRPGTEVDAREAAARKAAAAIDTSR